MSRAVPRGLVDSFVPNEEIIKRRRALSEVSRFFDSLLAKDDKYILLEEKTAALWEGYCGLKMSFPSQAFSHKVVN